MKIPEHIRYVINQLNNKNFTVLLAGECVRNNLIGCNVTDYELVTNAKTNQIKQIFSNVKIKNGINLIHLPDSPPITLKTFRDSRGRPTENIKKDAANRYLTINAVYYNPISDYYIDFFKGQNDIHNQVIRTIHCPETAFLANPKLLLEIPRIASELNCELDPDIMGVLIKNIKVLDSLSKDFIRNNLIHSLSPRGINILMESGIMEEIIPEIIELDGLEQSKFRHPEGDVLKHTICTLRELYRGIYNRRDELFCYIPINRKVDPILAFATLLHDIGKPFTYMAKMEQYGDYKITFENHDQIGASLAHEIAERLEFSKEEIDKITTLISLHDKAHNGRQMGNKELTEFLENPYIYELIELQHADAVAGRNSSLREFYLLKLNNDLDSPKPQKMLPTIVNYERPEHYNGNYSIRESRRYGLINGYNLFEWGFRPGPWFHDILVTVNTMYQNGLLNTVSEAKMYVKARWCRELNYGYKDY